MSNAKSPFRAPFLGLPDTRGPRPTTARPSTLRLRPAPAPERPQAAAGPAKPGYSSDQLFAGTNEIEIVHRGETYQLRITRQEKLILTK